MSTTRSVPRSPRPPRRRRRAAAGVGALVAVAALVTGCGDGSDAGDASAASTSATDGATAREAASITVTDGWVKAVDSGMTAAFGEIANTSDADITIVSATTAVSDTVELHETVTNDDGTMAMQPKEGGFVVPAGGTLTLEPGGNHIMFMGVSSALKPGQTVPVTLKLSDGSTLEMDAVVKEFSGADENYQNGDMGDMGDMSGMDAEPSEGASSSMHQHADGTQHDHAGS